MVVCEISLLLLLFGQQCDLEENRGAGTYKRHCVFSTNDRNLCHVGSRPQRDYHSRTLPPGVLCADSEEIEGLESIVQARRLLPLGSLSLPFPWLCVCWDPCRLVPYASCSVYSVPIPFFICSRVTSQFKGNPCEALHVLLQWLVTCLTTLEDLVYLSKF